MDIACLSVVLVGAAWWAHGRPPAATLEVPSAPTLHGLVGCWRGEDGGRDSAGHHDAVLMHGVAILGEDNLAGSGFGCDGRDNYVNLPDAEDLRLTQSLTLEARFRAESVGFGWNSILFRGDDRPALDPYFLSLQRGRTADSAHLVFHVESMTQAAELQVDIPLHTELNVAGTLDDASNTMRLYVYGEMVGEQKTTVRPFKNLDPTHAGGICIGNHAGRPNTSYNYSFHGVINEIKIYNRALSQAEELVEAGATHFARTDCRSGMDVIQYSDTHMPATP
jgi:hypothetical protein